MALRPEPVVNIIKKRLYRGAAGGHAILIVGGAGADRCAAVARAWWLALLGASVRAGKTITLRWHCVGLKASG